MASAQFRQPHYLHPAGRAVLEAELPDVCDAMLAAGAVIFNPLLLMPPWMTDRAPREGDPRFPTITGRRPTLELAVAITAAGRAGRRGPPRRRRRRRC